MEIYVLARNKAPEGNIEAVLSNESSRVKAVFDSYSVTPGSLIPSKDGARFAAIQRTPIPPMILEMIQEELKQIGYGLEGPFTSFENACKYWQTGTDTELSLR